MSENKGVEFELLNPSGNITALVPKDIPREKYQEIANEIMNNNPQIEQVGFLKKYSDSIFRLEMAGLEFCGNGSRAFACFLVKEKYVSTNTFQISVSGYDDLIDCEVEVKDGNYYSSINMKLLKPINDLIQHKVLNKQEVCLVNFPGISHLLLDQKKFKFDKENCQVEAKKIIQELDLFNLSAVGVVWFDNNRINPVVYVKDIDSLFYENSCGSGSMSYGLYHAFMKKEDGLFKFDVVQKNGEVVGVEVELKNKIVTSLKLSGPTTFSL